MLVTLNGIPGRTDQFGVALFEKVVQGDYVVRHEGKRGQQWLRAVCERQRTTNPFFPKWREDSNQLFEAAEGEDVFRAIEARWREFAEKERDALAAQKRSR